MIPSTLRNVGSYTNDKPDLRNKFLNLVDAFEYAPDTKDQRLLTAVLNRMTISPGLASAMCALCVGYEDLTDSMRPREKESTDKMLRSIGRITKRIPNTETLRRHIRSEPVPQNVNPDNELAYIERLVGLNEEACLENGGQYRNNRCNVVKDNEDLRCGLNTRFNCEYGSTVGMRYCTENQDGTRCTLSDRGRKSKKRKDAKRRSEQRRR